MSFVYEQLRFLVRGGTAANLTTVNEVPLKRELVIETDTLRYKLGDGVTAWSALPYASGGGSTWRDGAGAPSNSLGSNGDYYLRTSNGAVYAKAGGVYTVVANIKGNDGAAVQMQVAGGFIQWRLEGSPPPAWNNLLDLALVTGDPGPPGADGDPGPPGPASSCFPTADFYNTDPGAPIEVGSECWIYVPFGFEITGYTIVCEPGGAIKIDVRRSTFAGWPAGPGDSICGGVPPELVGGDRAVVTSIPAWSTSVSSGNILSFVVTENNVVNRAHLILTGERA